MSTASRRRLMRDFRRIHAKDAPKGVTAAPCGTDIIKWRGVIFGPDATPWEGGTFELSLTFTEEYPTKPPHVRFLTKMFHPNIYANGDICLDILKDRWAPIYDVTAILTSVQSLLTDPNPSSPANAQAAALFRDNPREYDKRVRAIVELTWK